MFEGFIMRNRLSIFLLLLFITACSGDQNAPATERNTEQGPTQTVDETSTAVRNAEQGPTQIVDETPTAEQVAAL